MAKEDLVFNILARDRNAARTFKTVGDAAEHAGAQISKLSLISAGLGSLGGLGATATGGLLALPSLAVTGAAALGTLAVAVKGVGGALSSAAAGDGEAFADAMNRLAPSARDAVGEIRSLAAEYSSAGRGIQEAFFGPIRGGFVELTDAYMPTLLEQVPDLSRQLGLSARAFADMLAEANTVARVNRVLESSTRSTENLGDAITSITRGFLGLADSGTEFSEGITSGLASGSAAWDRWVTRAQGDGSLDRVFTTAEASVEGLMDAVIPLTEALYDLFASQATQQGAETLFAVLGSGVQIVTNLVTAFGALPGGVQSTMLVMGALGLTVSKMFAAGQALVTWTDAAGKSMEKMGRGGQIASRGLNAVATGAGAAGAALVATQIAGATLGESVNPQVEALSRGMVEWAKTGKAGGETARVFGKDLENLKYDLESLSDSHWAASLVEGVTGLGAVFDKSITHATERVRGMDQALSSLVQGGRADEAAAVFVKLTAVAKEQGVEVDQLKKLFPEYAAAIDGASNAQLNVIRNAQENARAQKLLNGTWEEAVDALGSLKGAYDLLNGAVISTDAAMLKGIESVKGVQEAFAENGKAIDRNSEAGLRNREAIAEATAAAAEAAEAKYKETGSLEAANKAWNAIIDPLRRAMTQAGLTTEQVNSLLNEIGKMPDYKGTVIQAPGAVQAQAEVDRLNAEIADLRGKQVEITESGAFNARQRVAALQQEIDRLRSKTIQITTQLWEQRNYSSVQEFRETRGYRMGGITPVHARTGLLGAARMFKGGPPLYAFAEHGTGQEAFIPKNGDTSRSRHLARRVVDDWLGGPEKIWPSRGGTDSAALDRLTAAVMMIANRPARVEGTITVSLETVLGELMRWVSANGGSFDATVR